MKERFLVKNCSLCKGQYGPEGFLTTNSLFYPDGVSPVCNDCLESMVKAHQGDWEIVDKICQYLDIPFVPAQWARIYKMNHVNPMTIYAQMFREEKYRNLHWGEYYKRYQELREANLLDNELPEINEQKVKALQAQWGANYDQEELEYLQDLYHGVLNTQSINGKLQEDQAKKLCKVSLEIEGRIRAGQDFDKLLKSYESLVKVAEFTPKNTKNANDFDSVGELFLWLEKRGWKNQYYDSVKKDIVDETLHNIQAYNQRLYTNESGIGDEITQRIEALKTAHALEESQSDFGTDEVCKDLDAYDNEGYTNLMKEEFTLDIGEMI